MFLGPLESGVLDSHRSHNLKPQTKDTAVVSVAVTQGPRGFLGAQSNDWVSGCTIRSQSWLALFKCVGKEEYG